MLYTALQAEAAKHFEARRQAVALLKTPEDVQRRGEQLRARFVAALGGLPERTPLNARVVGTLSGDGFRVERIIYESRPNHHVTALLWLPAGKGPFPGVLLPCGHDANGKAAASYQRAGMLLAKQGIAVLCYDPISQGERIQYLDRSGKPGIGSSTSEHTLVGIGALLVGECTASYRVWDGMRSLDYLAGRPEIDPKRLGCTGCSGGGTLTSYLMALDDRIQAAAPSCYITSLERLFATIGPQDGEQNIPGQVAFGMEHADYLTMRAPKPTLLLTASRDFFDIQGTWTTFREAKRVFGVAGHSERVDLAEFDTPHGYPKPQREAMARFMSRWLLGKNESVVEPELTVFKDADLRCTRTGQVIEDLRGKSAFDFNAERAAKLAEERRTFAARPAEERLQEVRRLLGLGDNPPPPQVHLMRETKRDGRLVLNLVFETEAGIQVPALDFRPEKDGQEAPVVLYVAAAGKTADLDAIDRRVKAGQRVIAVDLRSWGETAPGKSPPNRPDFWGADWKEAFLGLHLNRPLLGQRVRDLLLVVDYLLKDAPAAKQSLEVIGVGAAGPVVLHAAALHPGIRKVTLERSLVSWSAVVRTPLGNGQLANAVPEALKFYDLPDLAGMLAPRPLTIRAAVDPVGEAVTRAVLHEAYAPCKAAYTAAKAEKELVLTTAE